MALVFTEMTNGWSRRIGRPSQAVGNLLREMGETIARRAGDGPNHYLVSCEPQGDALAAELFGVAVLREGIEVRVNGQLFRSAGP